MSCVETIKDERAGPSKEADVLPTEEKKEHFDLPGLNSGSET